jgi:hypothetical protein
MWKRLLGFYSCAPKVHQSFNSKRTKSNTEIRHLTRGEYSAYRAIIGVSIHQQVFTEAFYFGWICLIVVSNGAIPRTD